MTETTPSSNSPFIVGVSGHRDLDDSDLPRLRAAVGAFFHALRAELPDTELRLLTGVAEGADLLVAETARSLGVRVEAVLPMPLARYAADFDGDSLARLRALLNHVDVDCIELVDPAEPEAGYGNLMHALLRRSSLLLALWDGESSLLPVGTADTVLRYLDVRSGGPVEDLPLAFIDAEDAPEAPDRLVYWIPTPRRGAPRQRVLHRGAPPPQTETRSLGRAATGSAAAAGRGRARSRAATPAAAPTRAARPAGPRRWPAPAGARRRRRTSGGRSGRR